VIIFGPSEQKCFIRAPLKRPFSLHAPPSPAAGLLKRLPKSGDVWLEEQRKLWLQLLAQFRLIYDVQGKLKLL